MRQRIILVDDDPDDRELFADAVSTLKLRADILLSKIGRDLLERMDTMDRSIGTFIFLDLNMPVMSGMEVLQRP